MKLAMEIEKEREHKVNKKKIEREAAMKVIQDNNVEKKKQMFAREAQKKKEADSAGMSYEWCGPLSASSSVPSSSESVSR